MPKKEQQEDLKNTFKIEPQEEEVKENKSDKKKVNKTSKKSARSKSANPFRPVNNLLKNEKFQKVTGLFFLVFSIYLLFACISYLFTWKADDNIFSNTFGEIVTDETLISQNWMGKIGALLSHIFIKKWFGLSSFLFAFLFFISGLKLFLNIKFLHLGKSFSYSFFFLIWISLLAGFFFRSHETMLLGGNFGYQSNVWLASVFGRVGTFIVIIFTLCIFLIVALNMHKYLNVKNKIEDVPDENANEQLNVQNELETADETASSLIHDDINLDVTDDSILLDEPIELTTDITDISLPDTDDDIEFQVENTIENEDAIDSVESEKEHFTVDQDYDPTLDLSSYKFPTPELLKEYDPGNVSVQNEELEANKNKIIHTLKNYSINIDKINATIGPTVTLYEIVPAPGVRISKIKNLEDDIALSLAALGIRIIAPMPGKGTIGIEVPNLNPRIVSMRSMVTSEAYQNCTYDLPIALGRTINNKPFIADLAKMPHLLIAGATGQGKSVGLNAIITSLLYKKHPSQLKLVLVDPKKVELTLFENIERHFLAKLPDVDEAILTDTKIVVRTLNSLCILMDERYVLLKNAQVRNIKEYNAKFIGRKLNPENGHHYMPYIVLVIDEFADLFMTAGKEVEYTVTRLAQLARAIGIHIIIATQRPSVNVITGSIKANFPGRIAFKVSAKVDSRTILDTSGADQLIGRGDMLISTGSELLRLQCALAETFEVQAVTEFIGSQKGYASAYDLPECAEEEENGSGNSIDPSERDPLFADAARLIVAHQHGSTSLIQRKLKLGYNRAGRIIDQLEAAGIIGPFEGSKAREVRIKDTLTLEQLLENKDNLI